MPLSFEFGGLSVTEKVLLFEDGNIENFLPENEQQVGVYFDDWGCDPRSFENGCEALIIKQIDSFNPELKKWIKDNIYKNGKPNFSDRDLIVLSGTKIGIGNSTEAVYATAKYRGLISQELGDFDMSSRNPNENNAEVYYAYGRTLEAQKKADEFNARLEIKGEWVSRDKWEDACKYGVLQVFVHAWYQKNGKYYNPDYSFNHAVLMCNYKEARIYDSYDPFIKNLESWDDAYYLAFKINITEKTMTKPVIKNNTLVQLVKDINFPDEEKSGLGSFGIYLDNKILIGDAGELLATFYMRNNGNTVGMTKALVRTEWNMFPKFNLKGESV